VAAHSSERVDGIADVRPLPLCYPEPHDGGRLRHLCLVRIESEGGAVGWGEAITGLPEASRAVALVVEQGLRPLLLGEDPTRIGDLLERMRTHTFWYGTGGIATLAVSAIDTALWDLAARLRNVPVHELLGGKVVDRVRLCASIIWDVEDLAGTAEWCRSIVARGYTALKAGWGRTATAGFGLDPVRDVELVRTVRDAVGPDVDFAADVSVHARWTLDHALEMANRLDEFDLAWLEDPLVFDDFEGYARLRTRAPMPIATGERLWRASEYRHLVDARAADIALVDPGRVEGISGMKAAVDVLAAGDVQFVPHSWSSAINTAAALSVFATSVNGRIFELKPDPSPMQHELVTDPFQVEPDGCLAVRDSPGLGVEVDEAAARRYLLR
jgi:L-alanine-DL-glutamate epimerase-like enolase superfamily enzyme